MKSLKIPNYTLRNFLKSYLFVLAGIIFTGTVFSCHQALAKTILFDFEHAPDSHEGRGINPTFNREGLSLEFSGVGDWITQWVNDSRSRPFTGSGSMRLSTTGSIFTILGDGFVKFSLPVTSANFYAGNLDGQRNNQPNFEITAIGPGNVPLSTHTLEPSGSVLSPVWSQIEFANIGTITGLRFRGMWNHSYWDDLTVTPVPEPSSIGFIFFAVVITKAVRQKY